MNWILLFQKLATRGFSFTQRIAARRIVGVLLVSASLTACSGMSSGGLTNATSSPSAGWLADGTITVARAVPAAQSLSQTTMLGFLPGTIPALAAPIERAGVWISIDRSQRKLTLFEGATTLGSFGGEGFDGLTAGTYQLALKQRTPLWYAPDAYFAARNLPVPAPGDRSRFRRGALGDFAIFLDKQTALHSGPVWSGDIGGIRMEENDLSRIYYRLEVGSVVEVR
jgi:hypothetical protein